jgi:hypothetical protein
MTGLVEKEEPRLHDERPRERQALLLAAGELGRLALGELFERNGLQDAQHALPDVGARAPFRGHAQGKGGVLEDRHVRPDRIGLEHHAEAAPVRRHEDVAAGGVDRLARHRDFAGLRALEAGDRAERSGLAAAARAKQREELAGGHVETHVLRGANALAAVAQIIRAQGGDRQHLRPPGCRSAGRAIARRGPARTRR